MRQLLLIIFVILTSSCSNRAVYDNIQLNNRNECAKLPPAQYDSCMKGVNKSFEDYQKERDEVIK
ncbi:MAG: hypothetical protein V2I33_07735 [Kangiellaceae bacterium]|jgi:hypothetical protein|nr:hypothetical protein [Kangiellaceae bacterium]